jgi:DNA-binding transcriptional MocR family regulator
VRYAVRFDPERPVFRSWRDLYGDLAFDPPRPLTAKSFDRKGLVLLCSSFSKILSPGYRVGWVLPGRFRAEVERLTLLTNVAAPLREAALVRNSYVLVIRA